MTESDGLDRFPWIRAWLLSLAAGLLAALFLSARAMDSTLAGVTAYSWTRAFGQTCLAVTPWVLVAPLLVRRGMMSGKRTLAPWQAFALAALVIVAIAAYFGVVRSVTQRLSILDAFGTVVKRLTPLSVLFDYGIALGLIGAGRFQTMRATQRAQALREAQLAASNAELRRTLGEAQLQALAARVKPHFLYNALNAAVGLMRRNDVEQAAEMLTGIAALFRRSSAISRPLVTLDEELEMTAAYLTVERYRIGDRMSVEIDVPSEARLITVPSLLLQPLVENAVRHGIAECDDAARLRLCARIHDDLCHITIDNDGPPLHPPSLEPGGEGLRITRELLSLHYQERASLSLTPTPAGARVLLTIPVHRA